MGVSDVLPCLLRGSMDHLGLTVIGLLSPFLFVLNLCIMRKNGRYMRRHDACARGYVVVGGPGWQGKQKKHTGTGCDMIMNYEIRR